MVSVSATPVFCAVVTANETVTPPVAAVKCRVSMPVPPPIVSFPARTQGVVALVALQGGRKGQRRSGSLAARGGHKVVSVGAVGCVVLHAGRGDVRVAIAVEVDPLNADHQRVVGRGAVNRQAIARAADERGGDRYLRGRRHWGRGERTIGEIDDRSLVAGWCR